jgi:hypothetical protein
MVYLLHILRQPLAPHSKPPSRQSSRVSGQTLRSFFRILLLPSSLWSSWKLIFEIFTGWTWWVPNVQILPGITQGGALNALQLAAKLHELILVASLGTIVMHVAQAHLIGNHGLPLGLLTNSFSVGSGDFLRTRAFWATAWTSKAHYLRFWLLSLLATLLATLAGPSSAIAVIPSLNWFPLNKPFDSEVLPYYVFNQSTVLWPDNVTGASANSADAGITVPQQLFRSRL